MALIIVMALVFVFLPALLQKLLHKPKQNPPRERNYQSSPGTRGSRCNVILISGFCFSPLRPSMIKHSLLKFYVYKPQQSSQMCQSPHTACLTSVDAGACICNVLTSRIYTISPFKCFSVSYPVHILEVMMNP